MFKFKRTGGPFGDCTCNYDIEFDRPYTVAEFINEVLTERSDEWGYIRVVTGNSRYEGPKCEYRYGKLLSTLPEEYLDKHIAVCEANGGWTAMTYWLWVMG